MNGLQVKPMRAQDMTTSGTLERWLAENQLGLAMTTGQSMRLLTLGTENDGRAALCESLLEVPRALWTDGKTMLVSSKSRIHRLTHGAAPGRLKEHEERLFVPRSMHIVGELDIGDIACDGEGRVLFTNTQFNCIATLDDKHNFRPVYRPPFISKMTPENRCYLSGLALRAGKLAYVTAYAQTDVSGGYFAQRASGGCIVDVQANKVVAEGLSMPRHPRVYQDKLWVLEAGSGHLGFWDFDRRKFEAIAFCPGSPESLAFWGPFAIVGYSLFQSPGHLTGLPLEKNIARKGANLRCGMNVIDLRSGDVAHWLRLDGEFRQICGVAILEGIKKPLVMTIG